MNDNNLENANIAEKLSKTTFSFLKGFVTAIKDVAVASGTGLKYVFDAGNEHKHYLVPLVNGILGNKFTEGNKLFQIEMSFRENKSDISVRGLDLKNRLKGESKTILIFIHGLIMDEVFWMAPFAGELGFGAKLDKELHDLPLYIRYNTGKHISENGKDLTNLLQELVDVYEDEIEHIVLITHSMGGLVARSAGYYAMKQNHNWIKKLSTVFLLGVPNDGSFLERIGHTATKILKGIPNISTKIIGEVADMRSDGIKDLRWGFLVDEDWQSTKNDAILNVQRTNVPPLPFVKYYIIAGTLFEPIESENSLISMYFGDGLVGRKSARGDVFHNSMDESNEFLEFQTFNGIGHLELIKSDQVYEFIKKVLSDMST